MKTILIGFHVSSIYDGNNRCRCLKARRDDKGQTYYEVITE